MLQICHRPVYKICKQIIDFALTSDTDVTSNTPKHPIGMFGSVRCFIEDLYT